MLVGLSPLLISSLDAPFFDRIVATDASDFGCGVVASRFGEREQQICARFAGAMPPEPSDSKAVRPLVEAAVVAQRLRWSTIVSARWRFAEHINSLEIRAISTGVRWALKSPTVVVAHPLRFVVCRITKLLSATPPSPPLSLLSGSPLLDPNLSHQTHSL